MAKSNREIKFRVWVDNEFGKEMVEFDCDNYSMKHNLLLQYTGLKDKNGVDIYEDDIVLFRDIKHKVVFINVENEGKYHTHPDILYWGLELEPSKQNREDGLLLVQMFQWDDQDYYEVIGNIYENPELLEEKK